MKEVSFEKGVLQVVLFYSFSMKSFLWIKHYCSYDKAIPKFISHPTLYWMFSQMDLLLVCLEATLLLWLQCLTALLIWVLLLMTALLLCWLLEALLLSLQSYRTSSRKNRCMPHNMYKSHSFKPNTYSSNHYHFESTMHALLTGMFLAGKVCNQIVFLTIQVPLLFLFFPY